LEIGEPAAGIAQGLTYRVVQADRDAAGEWRATIRPEH
jgi:hypothetical protein